MSLLRAALLALPILAAACSGASSEGGDKTPAAADHAAAETGAKADMAMGRADAPVTVIEYASLTCSHCADFHERILPAIKEKYIDAGKVRLIFREFPTAPTGLSYVASVLARCAADKGGAEAYFLVVSSLLKTQQSWISDDAKTELVKLAAQAGMDEAAFDACMERQDLVDLINANVKYASEEYKINATPSFVIGGETTGVRSVEDFEEKLDAALAAAKG
ncbi:MAG: DsbA family protein [Amphiplicatus sp.]